MSKLATQSYVSSLEERIQQLERIVVKMSKERHIPSFREANDRWQKAYVDPSRFDSTYVGYVVDTRDPYKMNRVKVFVPTAHDGVQDKELPWASPGTLFGSLDECGDAGVPPEGSTVYVVFESGNVTRPIYLGATHNVTRDATVPMRFKNEEERWGTRREDDHNPAANPDPLQLLPPWNSESYGGPDHYTQGDPDSAADGKMPQRPHIYGRKTPEKHFIQMVDGAFESGLKGKRFVMQTSRGHVLFMKDDAHATAKEIFENPYWDDNHDLYPSATWRVKPFNDHAIELDQVGLQLQSVAGARIIMDDRCSTAPVGNEWDSGWEPVGLIRSRTILESVTENLIVLSDEEVSEGIRSSSSGVFMRSAGGHLLELNDHEDGDQAAGLQRGFKMTTSAGHILELSDFGAPLPGRVERARTPDASDNPRTTLSPIHPDGDEVPNGRFMMRVTSGNRLIAHNTDGIVLACVNGSSLLMDQPSPDRSLVLTSSDDMRIDVGRDLYLTTDGDVVGVIDGYVNFQIDRYWLVSCNGSHHTWSRNGKIYLLTGSDEAGMPTDSAMAVAVGPTAYCANFIAGGITGYPHFLPSQGVFASPSLE